MKAQPSVEYLDLICRFLPAFLPGPRPGTHDRATGARTEEILAYVVAAVRSAPPTPIRELKVTVDGRPRLLYLKLDGHSRWGSIKGRTALALLGSVASRIGRAGTLVESTSGNLGVALAGICQELGIPFTAVVDSQLPPSMRTALEGSGAEILSADGSPSHPPEDSLHLLRRIAQVKKYVEQHPQAVWTNQYENPANIAVHRWWTGNEVERQLGSDPQAVFCPVSTGGSFTGLRECLTSRRAALECVAVDVHGSTVFGGPPGRRLLTGIGAAKAPPFLETGPRPRHVMVSDSQAIATCRILAKETGLAVGGSSGATILGCLTYLSQRPDLDRVLCICPDLADRYQETLFNDSWLLERQATGALAHPAAENPKFVFTGLSPKWC